VELMRQRNAAKRPGIKYLQADACSMSQFADGSFDIVFDKSTMDCLKCVGKAATTRCSSEIHRVLKDTGLYLCVSFHSPQEFKPVIEKTGSMRQYWDVTALTSKFKCASGVGSETEEISLLVCRKVMLCEWR